jgi:hypothetical protein
MAMMWLGEEAKALLKQLEKLFLRFEAESALAACGDYVV